MKPGDLCSSLLHYFPVNIALCELTHIFQVSLGEALLVRKLVVEVNRQTVNHPGPSTLGRYRLPPRPSFEVAVCDLKPSASSGFS